MPKRRRKGGRPEVPHRTRTAADNAAEMPSEARPGKAISAVRPAPHDDPEQTKRAGL